ncbi:MAG: hypothetical protein AAF846_20875 [Chloroflexota bacterium]
MTPVNTKQLIQQLRADGINDDGIRTRLINEGLPSDNINQLINGLNSSNGYQSLCRKIIGLIPQEIIPNRFLSVWLLFNLLISIGLFVYSVVWVFAGFLVAPIYGLIALFIAIIFYLQLYFVNQSYRGERRGFWGFLVLTVICLIIMLWINLYLVAMLLSINIFLFIVATYTSIQEKRKTKLIEDAL